MKVTTVPALQAKSEQEATRLRNIAMYAAFAGAAGSELRKLLNAVHVLEMHGVDQCEPEIDKAKERIVAGIRDNHQALARLLN